MLTVPQEYKFIVVDILYSALWSIMFHVIRCLYIVCAPGLNMTKFFSHGGFVTGCHDDNDADHNMWWWCIDDDKNRFNDYNGIMESYHENFIYGSHEPSTVFPHEREQIFLPRWGLVFPTMDMLSLEHQQRLIAKRDKPFELKESPAEIWETGEIQGEIVARNRGFHQDMRVKPTKNQYRTDGFVMIYPSIIYIYISI